MTEQAEADWIEEILKLAGSGIGAQKFLEDCTPGYYNREGQGRLGYAEFALRTGINAFQ